MVKCEKCTRVLPQTFHLIIFLYTQTTQKLSEKLLVEMSWMKVQTIGQKCQMVKNPVKNRVLNLLNQLPMIPPMYGLMYVGYELDHLCHLDLKPHHNKPSNKHYNPSYNH